jgi:cell division protein ZapA
MSQDAVKVMILDKEYLVACPPEEERVLQASARHLSDKMSEIRKSGKVVGIDRIAVMAGLNIAHEAIESGIGPGADMSSDAGSRLKKLNKTIDRVLAQYRQAELN